MTSQLFSDDVVVDAVFVVNDFSIGVDVIQWRLLRNDQENLLQRHCDGVCNERRELMSFSALLFPLASENACLPPGSGVG